MSKVRINNSHEGMTIYAEVSILYGHSMIDVLKKLREKIKKEIENLTAMYVEAVEVVAKSIVMPE